MLKLRLLSPVLGPLLLCASALALPARDHTPRQQAPRELHYTFDVHDPQRIEASLDLDLPRSSADLLLLPSQWAGQTGLYKAIVGLRVAAGDATLIPTHNPARWLIHTRSSGAVRIAYSLVQDWSGPVRHPLEHRAILGPTLFQFNGETGLVAPLQRGTDPVHVTFDFTGLPSGFSLVTSFGDSAHQQVSGPWSAVSNALFSGGQFNTLEVNVDGEPVMLALHGQSAFSLEEIAPRIHDILSAERQFWHDTSVPWYAVILSHYESAGSGGGGSGFTNAFNLFLSTRERFSEDAASLFAHEAFHFWNPQGLGPVEDTQQIAWFGEGFTRFYQDVLLQRSGLITPAALLGRVNNTIRDYFLSPRLHATNDELQAVAPNDHFGYEEPYLRGAIIALWLSSEIDRQSSGRHSLADLMLALRDGRDQPLTSDRIFRTAGRFVDAPTVARLRSFALDGEPVPLVPGALGPCVAFNQQPAWTFDLGFDPASLHLRGVVRGVEQGSNAYQAGVRDGQLLGGWSLWNGDPEREVTLTLQDLDGRPERLSFFPRGHLVDVPQAQPIPGCSAAPDLSR